ncbi:MAG: M20 peptidase aminoacylase family protein [Calditrichia bacterium]
MTVSSKKNFSTITTRVEEIFNQLVDLRRKLHRFPELAWQEYQTTEKLLSFLHEHNISNIRRLRETGLVAEIGADESKPIVLLRADIDALPIAERKSVDYASQNAGICHACGHDVHMTISCGVLLILQEFVNELPVNVRVVFQPAEEPIPSGAPRVIEQGVLKKVQAALGMHVEPALDLGTIGLTEGWVNAQSIRLDWELKGSGGHSARPQLASDPLRAGTRLVQDAYKLAHRRWNRPDRPVVLTFTRFTSSDAYNAIPETARLTATLRLTDVKVKTRIFESLFELSRKIESDTGVKFSFHVKEGAPPVVNHPALVRQLCQKWQDVQGSDAQIEMDFRSLGGDDFGWYSREVPSALIRFGIGTRSQTPQLHTGFFDVPEDVIRIAVRFFTWQFLSWDFTHIVASGGQSSLLDSV